MLMLTLMGMVDVLLFGLMILPAFLGQSQREEGQKVGMVVL